MSVWFNEEADLSSCFTASDAFAPGDDVDEHHDYGDHQQDVDEAAHGGTGHHSQQPEHEQHYRNCV